MMVRSFVFLILCLTSLKIYAVFSTTFGLFGDEAQYWLWSQDLDFGYLSKPPLIAWVLSFYTNLFGDNFESLKLFPIIFYFFTSVAIYAFCRKLDLQKSISLICAFSFLVMPAVSVSSFFISTDVILLLFWILSMCVLIEIRQDPSLKNFLIFGIMLGLSFLAKYAAIYFFISLIVLLFFDSRLRSVLYSNKSKFIIFLITIFIVVLPNIIWNAGNGWLTFVHTSDNANLNNINPSFSRGFIFLILQILMIGPILFIGTTLNVKKIIYDTKNIFLLSYSVPIVIIVFVESILVRANANWAAVSLICLLIFFIRSLSYLKNFFLYLNFFINFSFGIVFFLLITISSDYKIFDRINGIQEFSNELKKNLTEKSNIVVSDRLLYSSLAYQYKNEKFKLLMPLSHNQKITKHFQIKSSLNKEMYDSFLFVGDPSEILYLENIPNIRLLKESYPKFTSSPIKIYEVIF